MTARGRCALSIFFALLLGPLPALAQAPPVPPERPVLVKEIAVQGNRRVQEAVILGRVGLKIGSPFVASRTAEDIRAIFSLGFFDDVQVRVEDFEGGVKLTYVVTERPFVRDVLFSGNKKQDSSTLLEKIDLKLGTVYNPVEVNRAADKLKEFYETEGYFEVGITPEVEKLADGDVTITFRIAEGRRITIEQIVIEGTQGLTPKQVRGAMETQEREFYILRGTVQRQQPGRGRRPHRPALQRSRLHPGAGREVGDQGGPGARPGHHPHPVVEGPQFQVGGVDVTGNSLLPEEEIREAHPAQSGDVSREAKLRDSVTGIQDLYSVIGRASADVTPQHDAGHPQPPRQHGVRDRGGARGLRRAHQYLRQHPQRGEDPPPRDPDGARAISSRPPKLVRADQKLTNLDYFDKVEATTDAGSTKDKIVVNIEVTEKPTGLFSIGGGYSSQDGVLGSVDLSQRNFLGRGWEVFLRICAGGRTQTGHHRLHRALAVRPAPRRRLRPVQQPRASTTEYTVNSLGGDIRFGHPIGEFSRWNRSTGSARTTSPTCRAAASRP